MGLTTPPCGTPRLTDLPPSMRRAPFPSVVSTGDCSQSLINRSMSLSTMRRATDRIRSAWGMVSKVIRYAGRIEGSGMALRNPSPPAPICASLRSSRPHPEPGEGAGSTP